MIGANNGFSGAGDGQEDALKIGWNKELANSPKGVMRLLIDVLVSNFASEKLADSTIAKLGCENFG